MAKPLDWQALLVDGYEPLKKAQRVFRRLPHEPRCRLCQNPFAGVGGKLLGFMGRRPSRKNLTATDVLVQRDGIIDKLIGDEVMALFVRGFAGPDYRHKAALAALDLGAALGDLPVGVAANAGIAFVGNVGSGTVMDFTALGDAVNVGARLESYASPGEVVLATELYTLVAADHPGARSARIEVRGREEPVDVQVLTV